MIEYLDKRQSNQVQQAHLMAHEASRASGQLSQPTDCFQSHAIVQQQQHQPSAEIASSLAGGNTQHELIGYYFGSISRETAEWILRNHGNQKDGAYLLRSSGPNDDFVLSLVVVQTVQNASNVGEVSPCFSNSNSRVSNGLVLEVLHYKIVETEDSFVALHGQVGDEKFATIDELIDKAQGVATKPRWPIMRQSLESQMLPPTYWGLSVDQVRLAILIKAKQWGFPLLSLMQHQKYSLPGTTVQAPNMIGSNAIQTNNKLQNMARQASVDVPTTTLNNEAIRTLIYKSLHEFQPWFHGKITREEAERRIEEGPLRDGRFLVRERDNYSYAMCIIHKRTTKHYRIDVLPTGELAIQDGRKFTSLMALISHYTIMSDGLWCALTEVCPRPINQVINGLNWDNILSLADGVQTADTASPFEFCNLTSQPFNMTSQQAPFDSSCLTKGFHWMPELSQTTANIHPKTTLPAIGAGTGELAARCHSRENEPGASHPIGVSSLKTPIKEWLQTINHKWSQLMNAKNQRHSLNSFLFGNQNPLNNHCGRSGHRHHHHHHRSHHISNRRKSKGGRTGVPCMCLTQSSNETASCTLPGSSHKRHHANQLHGLNSTMKPTSSRRQPHWPDCAEKSSAIAHPRLPANVKGPNWPGQNQHDHNAGRAPINSADASSLLAAKLLQDSRNLTLNGQTFIGSPLFAINRLGMEKAHQKNLNHDRPLNSSGSASGSSSNNDNTSGSNNEGNNKFAQGKLISPAQSISGNLNQSFDNENNNRNNIYSLNNMNDIYGSQTSTAVVNDQAVHTSSGSSSGNLASNFKTTRSTAPMPCMPNCNPKGMQPVCLASSQPIKTPNYPGAYLTTQSNHVQNCISAQPAQPVTYANPTMAGPIMCGQHAGPAYRYTNCNGAEDTFNHCPHSANSAHHPRNSALGVHAADDLHVISSSTQLVGPAAMAKFVQFQDGRCLRTHRDTRSIQMAYLSSRRAFNDAQAQMMQDANSHAAQGGLEIETSVPDQVKNFNLDFQKPNFATNNASSMAASGNLNQNVGPSNQQNGPRARNHPASTMRGSQTTNPRECEGLLSLDDKLRSDRNGDHSGSLQIKGTDLMDCSYDNEDGFDFKYDPKLIKSSSIETLCGGGDDEECDLDRPNIELMMSLQSCWLANQQHLDQSNNILTPLPPPSVMNFRQAPSACCAQECLKPECTNAKSQEQGVSTHVGMQPSGFLESLINDGNSEDRLDIDVRKKHDLDELTTALLAELTASLKAQVDLKNKRAGYGNVQSSTLVGHSTNRNGEDLNQMCSNASSNEANPSELINEFDTLVTSNYNKSS